MAKTPWLVALALAVGGVVASRRTQGRRQAYASAKSRRLPRRLIRAIHSKRLGTVTRPDGVRLQVWEVNGRVIREHVDADFVSGGNPQRYSYEPENEIWVERGTPKSEIRAVTLHEVHEGMSMERGMSYNDAHDLALKVENRFRKSKKKGRVSEWLKE